MTEVTLPLALLAGIVSFASPCFLPVVPVFVGYLLGGGTGRVSRATALRQAVAFCTGFTAVFLALWVSLGLVGQVLADHRGPLRVVGGAVLILMGLHVAGLITIPVLGRTRGVRLDPAAREAVPSMRRSALLGLAFGAGWSPCIGPVLGAVLGLASVSDSAWQGTALLLAYALGLGIPFVLVALGAEEVGSRLRWLTRHHGAVALASGAVIVLTGFAMITDILGRLSGLAPVPTL